MEMLLRDVSIRDLAGILGRCCDRCPVPHLRDPKCVARARRLAKRNGLWDRLAETMSSPPTFPAIRRSVYRDFDRTGVRSRYEGVKHQRDRSLREAVLATWLDHPAAERDRLQDMIWAVCEETSWGLPAHRRGDVVDLGVCTRAADLAEIRHVLGDRLEDEVSQRIVTEVNRRLLDRVADTGGDLWWKTAGNNWNHVCNGAVVRTALFLLDDPNAQAEIIHTAVTRMTYALDAFAEDGGCREGPGYWLYGFGNYLYAAHALREKTGGRINIMADPKIERICRYPLANHIAGPWRAPFADASQGYLSTRVVLLINRFYPVPELFDLCPAGTDGRPAVADWHSLALYAGEKAPGKTGRDDALLPSLGQVKLRGRPGPRQLTLVAKAGDNGVPHNHNDVGSFVVHRAGRMLLTDPGAPRYNRRVFSPDRYEILYCNSLGHSVPLINGRQQAPGERHRGTLDVDGLDGEADKHAVIDMTRAYPRGTVQSLVRTLTLETAANRIVLEDAYRFARKPRRLEEAFVTCEAARTIRNGRAVQIGPQRGGLLLTAARETPGRFLVTEMIEESKAGRSGDVIKRITFAPTKVAREMVLRFEMG